MHTLSVFPHLFDFALLAPLMLRLALAYALARMVWNEKKFSSVESIRGLSRMQIAKLVIALFLAVGMYTQIATILALVVVGMRWNTAKKRGILGSHEAILYTVLCVLAVTLLFLGAGFLAFDLPL